MKICVTSQGADLDAQVDPRFGRCQYFIFADTGTGEFEAVQNGYASGTGGVGVKAGQLMAEKGVEYVLTGKVGPNATETLQAAGIKYQVDVSGPVKEVVEKFKKFEGRMNGDSKG